MATPAIYGVTNIAYGTALSGGAPASVSAGVLFMCREAGPAVVGGSNALYFTIDASGNLSVAAGADSIVVPLGTYTNTWILASATITGGVLSLYVNGVLVGTPIAVTIAAPSAFGLGGATSIVIGGGFWASSALNSSTQGVIAALAFATGSLALVQSLLPHAYFADRAQRPLALTWLDEGTVGGSPLAVTYSSGQALGIVTPGDFLSIGGGDGGGGPTPPQEDTIYYVASDGSDENNGLTEETPFLTVTHAESLIPLSVEANYQIVILDADATFDLPDFRARSFVGGQIYVRSVVDDEIFPSTAPGGGTSELSIDITGLGISEGAWLGYFIEADDGSGNLEYRQVQYNTATAVTPTFPFTAAPATFRIFLPSTQLVPAGARVLLNGGTYPNPGTLNFERIFMLTTSVPIQCGGNPSFYACVLAGISLLSETTVGFGCDAGVPLANGPAAAYSVSNLAFSGCGVLANVTTGVSNVFGFFANNTGTTEFGAKNNIIGGILTASARITAGAELLLSGAVGVFVVGGLFEVSDSAYAYLTAVQIIGSAQVSESAHATLNTGCSVTNVAGVAVSVNRSGALEIANSVQISGSTYGILAATGGRVYIDGLPNVTGSTADLAVGNVPTTAASATLSAAGIALLPAVTLDGSIIQRTA